MADTRILAVLYVFKSGTTLDSIKVKLARAAVESRNVSAEVVFDDKPIVENCIIRKRDMQKHIFFSAAGPYLNFLATKWPFKVH